MSTNNSNIAATIIPTDSGRELLQDIYGGGGGFTLIAETDEYQRNSIISSEVQEQIANSDFFLVKVSGSITGQPDIVEYAGVYAYNRSGSSTNQQLNIKARKTIGGTDAKSLNIDLAIKLSTNALITADVSYAGTSVYPLKIKFLLYSIDL